MTITLANTPPAVRGLAESFARFCRTVMTVQRKEDNMTALDVAEFILTEKGTLPAMKLQKLVYYSQAWSLVWDDRAMFDDRIEAWANGPVCPRLYDKHRGEYSVDSVGGDITKLDDVAQDTVNAVLKFYGDKSSLWLSELTHSEDPWKDARGLLPEGARSNAIISLASMAEYYAGL